MQNELINQWNQLNRQALDSFRELGEINARAASRIFQQQLEFVNASVEAGVRRLNQVYEPQLSRQLLGVQTALAGELNEKFVAAARRTNEVLVQSNSELSAWAEKGVRTAAAQTQQVMQQTQKAVQQQTRQATQQVQEATQRAQDAVEEQAYQAEHNGHPRKARRTRRKATA